MTTTHQISLDPPHAARRAGGPLLRSGAATIAAPDFSLPLESGGSLDHAQIAYETFGPPGVTPETAERVVLVCHALTGDAHVTRQGSSQDTPDPGEKRGWWETLVGPGRPIDTRRDLVICSNVLGGCSGSTGPTSINPATRRPWGPDFPRVTITDMVRAQFRLLDELGVTRPITVVGGSIGGFQALEWVRLFPDRVEAAAVIASGTALNAFGLAFNRVARNIVRADPLFAGGRYDPALPPAAGLAAARQLAHLTYRTSEAFEDRFARAPQPPEIEQSGDGPFAVQSYLEHKGRRFVERFDANTYLTLLDAMDSYDADREGDLPDRLSAYGGRLLVAGFSSDNLFPPEQSAHLAQLADRTGIPTTRLIIDTDQGHDAFLMPSEKLEAAVRSLITT